MTERHAVERPFRGIVRHIADGWTDVETIAGQVRSGDTVCEARSGTGAQVVGFEETADVGNTRLSLAPAIPLTIGDVLSASDARPEVADQFAAHLHWAAPEPLIAGRTYRVTVGAAAGPGSVTAIKHRLDPGHAEPLAARTLRDGEVGVVNLSLREPVAFDLAEGDPLRRVEIADPSSGDVLGEGTLDFALRRAANIHWQAVSVTKQDRAIQKAQRPVLVWFTGLSGAGKSTVANLVETRLLAAGCHTYLLDGDNVRHGLNRDLGFTEADRVENIRRVAELGKLMVDAGLIVLASFISPFRSERAMARELMGAQEFVEVFVDAPLAVAEARDPKGLYRRARKGELRNFTGIDSPYEAPLEPELHLRTGTHPADQLADEVVDLLARRGHLAA